MILKEAAFRFTDINPLVGERENGNRMMRTASGRVIIEPGSEKARIVEAEIKKHPNALFFRAKAIEADCPNTNGDYFSWEELLSSYKSFEGVPFFTNHDNQNVENARGKVIFAEAVPEEHAIYTICFIDRDAYPHICRSIEEEYVTGVSMGSMLGDALITMADGTNKPIKDVVEGDYVMSPYFNKKRVSAKYAKALDTDLYSFEFDSNQKCPVFSHNHPIMSGNGDFIEAKDFNIGDEIAVPNDEKNKCPYSLVKITDIKTIKSKDLTYDLTVEDDECYIANNLAVHNCSVEYSVCNICGNVAERTEDYCSHIRNRKGRTFSGRARNIKTGEEKKFDNEPVFEYNYGLKFIELSAVVDPACPNCHIEGIIPNDNYLAKVAAMENELRMIRTAAIEKKASQEEIDQIEQCLETLEQIAINLIQNRQQVEMEFSSDLVKIMSDLQTWLEELIGAGYGNIGGEVPGTVGDMEEPSPGSPTLGNEPPIPEGVPSTTGTSPTPMPVSSGTSTEVGSISGSPAKPATSAPQLPITAPVKPRTSDIQDSRSIQRISDVSCSISNVPIEQRLENGNSILRKALNICQRINKTGEIEMGARRTIAEKKVQKKKAIEILSNSWEEKQAFSEYIKKVPSIQNNDHRLSVNRRDDSFIIVAEDKGSSAKKVWTYEDLTEYERKAIIDSPKDAAIELLDTFANNLNKTKEGVKKMTDISKEAGATTVQETPAQVQEGQLERSDLYHARQKDDKHSVTQKQLEEKRKGEKNEITEGQLDDPELKQHPRMGQAPDRVQEGQMTGDNRLEDDKHSITQRQLPDEGKRVNNEPNTITEDQLRNIAAPWARAAGRDASMFRSASEHMQTVVDVMASSAIKTGCTPEEACSVAASLVDSLESRYNLGLSFFEDSKPREEINYAKRVAYWQNKNLKVASVGTKEIAEVIVDGLRVYATDETINPDLLMDAVDIVSEGQDGIDSVSAKIEEKLEEAKENKTAKVSRKDELRAALKPVQKVESSKEERNAERKKLLASIKDESNKILNKKELGNADTVIETNFDELGTKKEDKNFKQEVVAFTKGALASQNLRLGSITNVTISGDTIQIAVQTDTEENEVNIDTGDGTTEIPIGGSPESPAPAEEVPEGDMAGEGLENSWASSKKGRKMRREAQSPMGGGMPGTPGGVAAPGAPEQGLPGPSPMEGDPIQALTTENTGDEAEIPSTGERQMPWTVCPECGSTDVDVSNEGGDIRGSCNACGAEYEALIKKEVEFKIIKPTKSVGENGVETPEEPSEVPEVPALPVAAQTSLGKDQIIRIANNKEKHGHVCPACGTHHCKPTVEADGHTEFVCQACGTPVQKDLMVSASNPEVGYLRVQWDIFPDVENCKDCKEEAFKFASEVRIAHMLKTAAANADDYPMSACMERLARKYGGDTVASFGPCKGKLLAECVCGQLQKLGFRKIRHLNKFASISMEKDPYDECIEDQTKNEGHDLKQAEAICNCIKKRFASEWMQNVYAQAFAEDVEKGLEEGLTKDDLATLDRVLAEEKAAEVEAKQKKLAAADEADISSEIPPADFIEVEAEVVDEGIVEAGKKPGVPDGTGPHGMGKEKGKGEGPCKNDDKKDAKKNDDDDDDDDDDKDSKKDSKKESSVNDEIKQEASIEINPEEEKKLALAMNSKRVRNTNEEVLKMASTPKQVKDIEGNVEAGVPRSNATIRNEGADNIDVAMAQPDVPRAKSEMGNEGADNINPKAGLPEIPVDSSYMGHEKEIQGGYDHANSGKGMPTINNEIKGTVIAEVIDQISKDSTLTKAARITAIETLRSQAKKMKEIDTVEGDVEAGVPRSDATIRNEGADNIDVPAGKPDVPRANAEMGNEGADNINPKAEGPDVPVDNAYMGYEKEIQQGYDHANRGKGMPEINDKILKQVKQKRQVQLDRIAQARKNEAVQTTAWLVANNRIASDKETFDTVVQSLMNFETDQIQAKASAMFPEKTVKMSATQTEKNAGYSIPAIVQEPTQMMDGSGDLTKKLASSFTIGNSKFDEALTIYGEK
jgi:hypothetical protein